MYNNHEHVFIYETEYGLTYWQTKAAATRAIR